MKTIISPKNIIKSLTTLFALSCTPYAFANNNNPEIPLFTPFNWAESTTGYIIKGQICTHISALGNLGCGPVTMVVDTPNNRLFIDAGKFGGQSYLFKDVSYINNSIPGLGCLRVQGFSFASQIAGYQNVMATPGSTAEKATYLGLAADVASCKDKIAASMTVQKGILTEWNFGQMFTVPGKGAQFVTGMITLDPATVDTTSDRSHYFELPANCNGWSINYCSIVSPH